jgi:mono/diheme cytochrome c family protein
MTYRSEDPNLERSTDKWMVWGLVFMLVMIVGFVVYIFLEPAGRADALEAHETTLTAMGSELYELNCVSCHGADGEGGIGPALNSQEFLTSADDTQIRTLISVGIPGSLMSAYALEFGGPLTAEEIDGLATYLRSWEEDAPENPDWRACCEQ